VANLNLFPFKEIWMFYDCSEEVGSKFNDIQGLMVCETSKGWAQILLSWRASYKHQERTVTWFVESIFPGYCHILDKDMQKRNFQENMIKNSSELLWKYLSFFVNLLMESHWIKSCHEKRKGFFFFIFQISFIRKKHSTQSKNNFFV
jgi:hypothetical protein